MDDTSNSPDLCFYFAGFEACKPNYTWKSLRDHYIFHYVVSGHGVAKYGLTDYHLGPGQGFLFFPGEISSYQADARDPWTYVWIAFVGRQGEERLAEIGLSRGRPIYETAHREGLSSSLLPRIAVMESSKDDLECLANLYGSLYDLKRFSANPSLAYTAPSAWHQNIYVASVLDYIYKNFHRHEMTVEGMAEKIGLSRKYLSAMTKSHLGVSPQGFLIEYRMYRASQLLSASGISVQVVASSVGYEDPLAFSRAFKLWSGRSPSSYRRFWSGKEAPKPDGALTLLLGQGTS